MYQYKTLVTDYEGMQEAMTAYGAQGWRLLSANPDTWRVNTGKLPVADPLGMVMSDDGEPREFSASFYLLVFERENEPNSTSLVEVASESHIYPDYSLPDY